MVPRGTKRWSFASQQPRHSVELGTHLACRLRVEKRSSLNLPARGRRCWHHEALPRPAGPTGQQLGSRDQHSAGCFDAPRHFVVHAGLGAAARRRAGDVHLLVRSITQRALRNYPRTAHVAIMHAVHAAHASRYPSARTSRNSLSGSSCHSAEP